MRKAILLLASMAVALMLAGGVAWAAAGELDSTFSGDGKVRRDSGHYLMDLVRQPDGKLLAGGGSAMDRFNSDGSPDLSFGTRGRVFITGISSLQALALQEDGKIVGAGAVETWGAGATLLRFNPGGSPDPSFGGDGRVEVANMFRPSALAIQANGKIVVAGSSTDSEEGIMIARFKSDGTPDLSFGDGDGVVTTAAGDFPSDVGLWQGKLIVATEGATSGAIVRYESDGTPDETFGGGDGIVQTSVPNYGAAVLSNGGIVTCGIDYRGPKRSVDFVVERYRASGTPAPNFGGGDGRVVTNILEGEASYDIARDLVVQSDGRIVVAGSAALNPPNNNDFALVRYNPTGSLNRSFGGGDGKVLTDMGANERGMAALLEPNGKIVVGGSRYLAGSEFPDEIALARYLGE